MGFKLPHDTIENLTMEDFKYYFDIQKNIGNKWEPQFNTRKDFSEGFKYPDVLVHSIGDINGDNLLDLLIIGEIDSNDIQYPLFYIQKPDGSYSISRLTDWELEPFGSESIFLPQLIDLDLDGDLDILFSGAYPSFEEDGDDIPIVLYAKNTGSPTNPKFLGWFTNPYGLNPDTTALHFTGADYDLDGDIDFLGFSGLDSTKHWQYFENHQDGGDWPEFTTFKLSPFGLPTETTRNIYLYPNFSDIDFDGDIDLFLPLIHDDTIFKLEYYENTLCKGGKDSVEMKICQGDTIWLGNSSYSEPGEYFIEETNSNGCKSITYLTLEVTPASTTHINETLCYGETYNIGGQDYTETGIYELSLMSHSGCDSTIIADLEFIELNTDISLDEAKLVAHKDYNYYYQWFNCDTKDNIIGATEYVFEPNYSGNFAVKISNYLGCEEISECYYVVATELKSVFTEENIVVMPNPTKGIVKIRKDIDIGINLISLFDRTGRLLQSSTNSRNC